MRLNSFNTLNTEPGRIVSFVASSYLFFKILKSARFIVSEIRFYHKNKWNFELDSNNACWMEREMKRYFGFMPIGQMKLLVESLWTLLRLTFIFFLLHYAYFA
jgi:hypothetical protein